jgi:formate dehydrogenase subunit delta
MSHERLVERANAVGRFFEAMPDPEAALDGVAAHFRRYWPPSLRAELRDLAQTPEQARALHPLVMQALRSRPEVDVPHPPGSGSVA